ncbi:MAG: hypothetical protein SAJ72_23830 [Jaaginema sp. PMC 1080.18]|nr:hypothetical protein [Jaaginema sp. PMC 1080.18]MEC4868891.1 hypothetical protein [Jaaginema sp. PMC 1078.18]
MIKHELKESVAQDSDEHPQVEKGSNEWKARSHRLATLEKLKREAIATPAKK